MGPQAATAALLLARGWRWLSGKGAAGAFHAPLLIWCDWKDSLQLLSIILLPPSLLVLDSPYSPLCSFKFAD